MSEDTPTGDNQPASHPADETQAAAAAAATPEPAAPPADATAPDPGTPEPPAVPPATPDPVPAEPVTAGPVTAETAAAPPPAAEPVTAETAAAPPTAVPVAPVAAAPPDERRKGLLVPIWAAVLVAVLLIGGIGFAIGYATGDDGGSDSANASSSQVVPNGGTSTLPNRGNGGTSTLPNRGNGSTNGNNNGNANGNGSTNGNGNGQTTAQIAFLGVALQNAPSNGGAQVTVVRDGSPAADAGLKSGDVVTKVDDTAVTNASDLTTAIRAHKPGDVVTVTYTRDGTSAQAKVTLGNLSDATRS